MTVRENGPAVPGSPDDDRPPGWRLVAFAIVAGIVVITLLITHSVQAVVTIVPPLLLLLAWLAGTGRRPDDTDHLA